MRHLCAHTGILPRTSQKKNWRVFNILLTFTSFFILGMLIFHLPANQPDRNEPSGRPYIIDGDTVVLGKTHIRLKGIDAPEIGQSCEGAHGTYDCGGEARNKLRARIGMGVDSLRKQRARPV